MIRGPLVSIPLASVMLAISAAAQHTGPRQFGLSPLDGSLACIERLYGMPVLRHEGVDNRLRIDPCPGTRDALSERLKQDTLRLFTAGDFMFLMAGRFLAPWPADLSPYAPRMKWNAVKATWRVRSAEGVPETLAKEVAWQVLKQTRPLPLSTLEEAGPHGAFEIALNVELQIVGVGPDSTTTLLALVDDLPVSSAGRLAFGTLHRGRFELLWESPLVRAGAVSLLDVTGDGRPEILVESTTSGNQMYPVLVIFDTQGRELTRQTKCQTQSEGFDALDGVCAIYGAEISLSTNETGPKQIRVSGWSDGRDHVFRLRNGRYRTQVPVRAARRAGDVN